jgi:uncharacterized damage-inducible protein DinB
MAEVTTFEMIRELYDYHWWANHRLFDVAVALGEGVAGREVGGQFSYPTIRRMLAHLYGADAVWISRWKGDSPTAIPGGDVASLADLRQRWDTTEQEQREFVHGLSPADLTRVVSYKATDGTPYRVPLWPLLQHVANHATHHRSEVATMITMVSSSPPATDLVVYQLIKSGQRSS